MLVMPMKVKGYRDRLVIIINKSNLERLQASDPVAIAESFGLENPEIIICYEEDSKTIAAYVQRADIGGLMKWLHRGWKFQPDLGDHDRGAEQYKPGDN